MVLLSLRRPPLGSRTAPVASYPKKLPRRQKREITLTAILFLRLQLSPKSPILNLLGLDPALVFVEDERARLDTPARLAALVLFVGEGRVQHLAEADAVAAVKLLEDEWLVGPLCVLVVPRVLGVVPHREVGRLDAVDQHDIDAHQVLGALQADVDDGEGVLKDGAEGSPDLWKERKM